MGLFSFLFKSKPSRYEAHGEILEQIARDIADYAVKKLSKEKSMILYLRDNGKEICFEDICYSNTYYRMNHDDYHSYSFPFSRYGMHGVSGIYDNDFLTALLPHLKAQIAPKLPTFPPLSESIGEGHFVIQMDTHLIDHSLSQFDDESIPAIIMNIDRSFSFTSDGAKLKSW